MKPFDEPHSPLPWVYRHRFEAARPWRWILWRFVTPFRWRGMVVGSPSPTYAYLYTRMKRAGLTLDRVRESPDLASVLHGHK